MKYFFSALLLIFWMATSAFLAITVIGLILILNEEWFDIPARLLKVFND